MAKQKSKTNSLTGFEVQIIKKLLHDGNYTSQEILAEINFVRLLNNKKSINPGRINTIKSGKEHKSIAHASEKEVNDFLNKRKSLIHEENNDPIDPILLNRLLPQSKHNKNQLNITETDQIECKESLNVRHWATNYLRTVAAFANNKGGYLIFGVKDQTWDIIGIDANDFKGMDRNNSNQIFKSHLSCPVEFETAANECNGKTLGIIYIHPAKLKPTIFIKHNNSAKVQEGQIFYRNQGENRPITAVELQLLIEERIRSLSETILNKHLENILSNGIENSAVLNLLTGEVDGKAGKFLIDQSILPQLKFIKEGEFAEKSGAPALKLIGEIENTANIVAHKEINPLEKYPYSWTDLFTKIKNQIPSAKQNHLNDLIKQNKIKTTTKYATYNFRNKKQEDQYNSNGRVASNTPIIYSQAALEFLLEELKMLLN